MIRALRFFGKRFLIAAKFAKKAVKKGQKRENVLPSGEVK